MNQYDKKRKFKQRNDNDDEEEQIERTLKFFDSILDEYLCDDDPVTDVNNIEKSHSQTKFTNDVPVQKMKPAYKPTKSAPQNSSSGSVFQDSNYIHAHQFHDGRHRFEEIPTVDNVNNVRRHTSETNLNQITSSTKPVSKEKPSRVQVLQTTATSTDDLLSIPSSRNLPNHDHLSILMDKTNHLIANNMSASLIDLSTIDKVSARPRFRFVPPSNQNLNSNEGHIKKQQSNQHFEQYHIKPIPNERTSVNSQNKYSHKIVKPTVLAPPLPKSVPINHVAENGFHHENGKSAFKPHRSSKTDVSSKVQHPSPSSSSSGKRHTDAVHHPNLHVGITNPNHQLSDANMQVRQKHNLPQFHQSIPNLSQKGITEKVNSNIYASYASDQPIPSNFLKPPPYTPQSYKPNGHHPYQLPASSQDHISRWIQQVNNSSSISGLVHPSHNQPYSNGMEYRVQQPPYPYGSHPPINSMMSQSVSLSHNQPIYINQGSIPKYPPAQHSIPIQSAYPPTSSGSRNGPFSPPSSSPSSSVPSNIYHFHQNNVSREGQPNRNSHRQNLNVTSYL